MANTQYSQKEIWQPEDPHLPLPSGPGLGVSLDWSAGLLMKKKLVTGYYGKGENRCRPLGVDPEGQVYIPMAPDQQLPT